MARFVVSKLLLVGVLGTTLALAACDHDQVSPATPSAGLQAGPAVMTTAIIEGTIDGLSAPSTIVVAGNRIQLDAQTVIRNGSMGLTFADLRVGARSRVTAQSDGTTLRGTLVDVLDPVGAPTLAHGLVSGVAVDGNGFQFRIGDQLVRGNSDTQVRIGSNPASATQLRDGLIVDVNGLQRADYIYPTSVTMKAEDFAGPAPSPSPSPSPTPSPAPGIATVGGTVNSVNGVCPTIAFTVGGSTVVTDNSTNWTGGVCASLAPGASVTATGTRNGNTVVARQVSYP